MNGGDVDTAVQKIANMATEMAQSLLQSVPRLLEASKSLISTLEIHSPSKLFKEEVGKNLALGVGEGFTDEMKIIQKEMENAIPTNFETDIKTNINTVKMPLESYQNEAKTSGFNIYMENFINNRSHDMQAFAQKFELKICIICIFLNALTC